MYSWPGKRKAGVPLSLSQMMDYEQGERKAARPKPGMPKLEFMNGTKWGKVKGNEAA
jgi:hypothetical protein